MSFLDLSFLFFVLPISAVLALALSFVQSINIRKSVIVIFCYTLLYYYFRPALLLFLMFILVTYLVGNVVYHVKQNHSVRRKWCLLSCLILVSILLYVKYVPVILNWLNRFGSFHINYVKIVSMSGISFIIFESISYILDISRGDGEPGSILDYALFISYFPKLVSGPIVKWKDFQPQLTNHRVSSDELSTGIGKVIIGYAKKIIIADSLGASIAFIQSKSSSGADQLTYWLVALLYFFEIYFDFSGYSDIAIGISKMLGFSIKENFVYPYASKSITDFWRRWHVSLGDWFKDYVYIPLGGNRRGNVYLHLFIVFLLTGIWHGANMTFFVWGIAHGLLIVVERAIRNRNWYKKIPSVLKWCFTMIYVFFAWILFMSPNLSSALNFYRSMFISSYSGIINFTWRFFLTRKIVILLIVSMVVSVLGSFAIAEKLHRKIDKEYFVWLKYAVLLLLFILDIVFLVNSSYSPFIYMQF